MNVTLTQMCDAVRDELKQADKVKRAMSVADFKESIPDVALLQVYPESGETAMYSGTDRTTFRAGVRHSQAIIHVDCYARVRSQIGQDMKAAVELADAVINRLEQQRVSPYFGLQGLKAFRWTWERVTFTYGDPETKFAGIRFVLSFDVY